MNSEEQLAVPLSERVLGTIEKQGIAPKPRWHFLLHEGVVWSVAVLAFALGSFATALTLYIADASTFIEHRIEFSSLDIVFEMVPFMWLLLIAAGVFYTIHALRSTKRGYRWHTSWLVALAIGASLGVGYSMHAAGISAPIDRYLLSEMPFYQPLTGYRPIHWMNQDEGVVAGVVNEVRGEEIVIGTIDGREILIRTTPHTTLHGFVEVEIGMPVRIVGTTTDEDTFEASDVGPFRGRGAPAPGGRHGPVMLQQQGDSFDTVKENSSNERSRE